MSFLGIGFFNEKKDVGSERGQRDHGPHFQENYAKVPPFKAKIALFDSGNVPLFGPDTQIVRWPLRLDQRKGASWSNKFVSVVKFRLLDSFYS